ncbi:hypothetical protein BPT24_216 [Tenacibaculum phage pT24]|uniref:Uncharacterized protein n=1 Tax=Tenacibaculum phage pT24 TaxID=1880590 RepID=A0A1B4XX06_9CAUD|nr:hypothetical protein HYP10_gp216 [Tenacibaculum phage pT24]BAV39340.1 hypothetical protein BPT24_216 [Tenacibaculum phage pT24]
MKIVVEYKVMLRGAEEVSKLTETHLLSEALSDKERTLIVKDQNGGEDFELKSDYSIADQFEDYLDETDLSDWMDSNDVSIIINYKVLEVIQDGDSRDLPTIQSDMELREMKQSTESFEFGLYYLYSKGVITNKKLILDCMAVYSKMYDSIKDLKTHKQIDIVLKATGVAYDSASNAYQHMTNILKSSNSDEMKELIKSCDDDEDILRLKQEFNKKQRENE